MEKNLEYWLCWTYTIIIDSHWKEINKIKMRINNEEIKNNILKSNQFTHSSIMIRKVTLDKVWWFYKEKFNWAEDYELWLRIWRISKMYNLKQYLVKYRWLETSISRKRWLNQKILWIKIIIINRKHYSNFLKSLILRIWYIFLKLIKYYQ
jgi:hypothetical protein